MLSAYGFRVAAAPSVGSAFAALGARLHGAVLSTAAVTQQPQQQQPQTAASSGSSAEAEEPTAHKTVGKADPNDAFIFKAHCRGKREMSEDAKQTAEILRRSNFGKPRSRALHTTAAEAGDERSVDDAAQEIVEQGSKRLMQSEEGREKLRQGSFDLDATTERILEEGKKGASPETAQRAEQEDVKESVKSRVVSGSQTT
ncbi:hypothetical protein ABPG77_001234 [Micractinium sp. CCAP 211/92]